MHRLITLSFPLALALGACDTDESPVTADEDVGEQRTVEVAGQDGAHGRRHHGDRHQGKLARLCAELDCSDAQAAAIKDLLEDLAPRGARGAHRDGFREANEALADAFRAGGFGPDALASHRNAIHPHADAFKTGVTNALVGLHGILSADQRAELAELIEAHGLPFVGRGHHRGRHMGPRGEHMGPRGEHMGPRGERGAYADAGGPDMAKVAERMTQRLCEVVTCEADQQAEVLATLQGGMQRPDPSEIVAAHRGLANAFRADDFGPAQVEAHLADVEARRTQHMARRDGIIVQIHGLLSPEQRDILADRIERRGPHALGFGPGRHGPGKRHRGRK